MTKKLLLLTGFWLLIWPITFAQSKKVKGDVLAWGELGADYFLENQSFFYVRTQARHNTNSDIRGLKSSGALSNFYQTYFLLGYDQKLTNHWRASVSARYTADVFNNNQIYQAGLKHIGQIGKTDFIKYLAYDLMRFEEGDKMGRIRPGFALERNFKLGNHFLRPHISYEFFFYSNFKEETGETRTVDRTRLRLAASYQVSKLFWFTPFFTRQTEYYITQPSFSGEIDAAGKPVIKDPGGNRNRIEPIFGLELRFLFPGRNVSETTIPNLGRHSNNAEEKQTPAVGL